MPSRTDITIAYIGGGSKAWAIALMKDLALCERLAGSIRLYDLDHAAAQRNVGNAALIFGHKDARTRFRVEAVRTAAAALKGADFVVLSIEPGPIQMRYADLEIPKKYGILQTVGDTVGPGGLCRALRAVGTYADYAHQIMRHCPRAWVINFTNPMTVCTAALYAAEPDIKAFGCCHEVFGTQYWLGELIKEQLGVPKPPREELVLDIAGVNHFTFATSAAWRGRDLFPLIEKQIAAPGFFADKTARARAEKRKGGWWLPLHLVSRDLFRRFGALGAAGERHLVEFVPWYLGSEKTMMRWGVLDTPFRWRVENARKVKPAIPGPDEPMQASGEEGAKMMSALAGLEDLITNVNMPNRGQVSDLPAGWVLESYAVFRRDRVSPITAKPLPPALAALQRRVIDTQRLTLQAALARDQDLALQALLSDPLVTISTDRAKAMLDEMLAYVKPMLRGGNSGEAHITPAARSRSHRSTNALK